MSCYFLLLLSENLFLLLSLPSHYPFVSLFPQLSHDNFLDKLLLLDKLTRQSKYNNLSK